MIANSELKAIASQKVKIDVDNEVSEELGKKIVAEKIDEITKKHDRTGSSGSNRDSS